MLARGPSLDGCDDGSLDGAIVLTTLTVCAAALAVLAARAGAAWTPVLPFERPSPALALGRLRDLVVTAAVAGGSTVAIMLWLLAGS